MSVISKDALREADETQRQLGLVKQALEQKDTKLRDVAAVHDELAKGKCRAVDLHAKLLASFDDRLQQERNQKEAELLREIASMRKAAEAKERRLKDLTAEKQRLEQREVSRGASVELSSAHTAIAKAFGELGKEHPCLRLFDEPMLKFTAILFRQPVARRIFYAVSAIMWLFALLHTLVAHS